jgi:hypothetical protein
VRQLVRGVDAPGWRRRHVAGHPHGRRDNPACGRGFPSRRGYVGATTPFVSYEAEDGTPGGGATVVSLTSPPTTQYSSPELEASGHAYVRLGMTGQYVEWTNMTNKNVTAFNVRYSIPDAPNGGGITATLDVYVNGTMRQVLDVNSKQTWLYEGNVVAVIPPPDSTSFAA